MTRDEYVRLPDLKEMVDSDRAMRIKVESLKAQGKWDYYNNCPLVPDKLRNEMLKEKQMKRDEIIRMAREADMDVDHAESNAWGAIISAEPADLEHFAALVAAKEREECAQVCEQDGLLWGQRYAAAIRARGMK